MWSAKCPKCGAKILLEDANAKVIQCASCGAQVRVNINVNYNYSKSEHTEHIVDDAKIKQAQNVDRVINLFASPIEERRAKKKAEEERIQREADKAERIRKEQEAKDAEEQLTYEEWASAQHEKHARQAGRAIAKAINYYRANERKILISVVLIVALLACRGVYNSINQKQEQKLAAHQAELARLKDEEIAASHLAMGEVKMPEIEIGMATDYRIVKQDFENAGFINITVEPVPDLTNTTTKRYNAVIEVTVDGVPRMNVGDWYRVDVPIVITYHTVGDTILTPQEEAYSIAQGLLHGKQD